MVEALMATDGRLSGLLDAKVSVPAHVVYRPFVHETVILNLQTGQYHGVNPTGARMLEVLDRAASVRDAVRQLAEEYKQTPVDLERDVCDFCEHLLSRSLIEIDAQRPA